MTPFLIDRRAVPFVAAPFAVRPKLMNLIRDVSFAAALVVAFGGAASAQDLKNSCRDEAQAMCGKSDISLAECMEKFDLWPKVPNECVGELQTMIEMEREVEREQSGTFILYGYSHGGALLDGPGLEHREVGTLLDSDWLEIVEDTDIWSDGYKWFRVETPIGAGFHWGGTICTESDGAVEGVRGTCDLLGQAEKTFAQVWDETPLALDSALLVEGPATGFGGYVPRRDQVYTPGETIYIYAEPRAFGYGKNGRLHTINLVFDLLLLDDTGEALFQQDEFGAFNFQSHLRNKEVMFNADISADLPPGAYTLTIMVRD